MSLPIPFESIKVRAGQSASFVPVGGRLFTDVTIYEHNSGVGPTDLASHDIPASTLKNMPYF